MDYDTPDAVFPPPCGGGKDNIPDYDTLLDGCCQVGMQIVRCGGEIQRAEDTVRRLLAAYSLDGEVFALPNCVWASVRAPDAKPASPAAAASAQPPEKNSAKKNAPRKYPPSRTRAG